MAALVDSLAPIADKDLIDLYSVVTGTETAQVQDAIDHADPGNWKAGYVRLFLSHSAKHKAHVGEIANELAISGIHGFVAHDTMAYDLAWQGQIEQALRTMDALSPSSTRKSTTVPGATRRSAGRTVAAYRSA